MFHPESGLILLPSVAGNTIGRPQSRHCLVLTLDRFSNILIGNLQRFVEIGDRSGIETIWTCCVTCLGHLTALSHLLSQRVPRNSMDDLCDLTSAKLGDLSREVHIEVYSHFDVLTEVRILVGFLQMCVRR